MYVYMHTYVFISATLKSTLQMMCPQAPTFRYVASALNSVSGINIIKRYKGYA